MTNPDSFNAATTAFNLVRSHIVEQIGEPHFDSSHESLGLEIPVLSPGEPVLLWYLAAGEVSLNLTNSMGGKEGWTVFASHDQGMSVFVAEEGELFKQAHRFMIPRCK
jgi:hypothetical protein